MCGICGIFHHSKIDISPAQICRMRDYMIERGPDAAGYEILPEIAIGYYHLALLHFESRNLILVYKMLTSAAI